MSGGTSGGMSGFHAGLQVVICATVVNTDRELLTSYTVNQPAELKISEVA